MQQSTMVVRNQEVTFTTSKSLELLQAVRAIVSQSFRNPTLSPCEWVGDTLQTTTCGSPGGGFALSTWTTTVALEWIKET